MDLFVLDDAVAHWQAELPLWLGPGRLEALVELAWHLRQRDTRLALRLADEADQLIAVTGALTRVESRHAGRLGLIRAEAAWLDAALDAAELQAQRARELFLRCADDEGACDAHWLLAWIAADQGRPEQRNRQLNEALLRAQAAGDALRQAVIEAALARCEAFRDLAAARAHWEPRLPPPDARLPAALQVWISDVRAVICSKSQQIGQAVAHALQMREAALATGQIARAITATSNIGFDLTRLKEYEQALDWMQRGLDLARQTGWPSRVGLCLAETAETLRQIGRLDAAGELLQEALQLGQQQVQGRWYALALNYLGDLQLDRHDYPSALATFTQLAQRADALGDADLRAIARRGCAHALGFLDRADEALDAAQSALQIACEQADRYNQIAALRVLADLRARHPPPDAEAGGSPRHYLQQALALASSIEGYHIPAELLEALAREHAREGDDASAYRLSLRALAAREASQSELATHRATVLQVRYETERMRAAAEHHRQLAALQAERAETLQSTNSVLQRLGLIGQEITAKLDVEAILHTLDRHVNSLLDATCFAVYLCDADGRGLTSAHFVEAGQPQPVDLIELTSTTRHAARCARDSVEIILDVAPEDGDPSQVPGTLDTLSALFLPLRAGERVIGVMTVQSMRRHAYGERERLIFRSLAAYGAIALDNAHAYRQLAEAEARYERVVSNISDALAIEDLHGRVEYANARLYQLHGLDIDAPLPPLIELVVEEHRDGVCAAVHRALQGELGVRCEYQGLHADGELRWIERGLTAIEMDGQRIGLQSALRDISEHKRAELDMQRALQKEQELGQLRSRFVAMTSHEFRTPLAGMLSSVQLLRHYAERMPVAERNEVFDQIEQSIARMNGMLENILLIGRAEAQGLSFRPAAVDLAALCRELGAEISRIHAGREGAPRLRIELDGIDGEHPLDASLLRHALVNLLSNAFKYSPRGGEVALRCRRTPDGLWFAVSDQGIGIPLADQARLFESFHRASNVGAIQGTGLGLNIVRQAVERHGGRVSLRSAPGEGSCFELHIPLTP